MEVIKGSTEKYMEYSDKLSEKLKVLHNKLSDLHR
jgi:hypothetical protein